MPLSDRLTTPRRFLLAVGAAYVLAWVLPSAVVDFSPFIRELVLDGVGATRQALAPIWPLPGIGTHGTWWGLTLSVTSAFTNVVCVVVFIHAWRLTSPASLTAMASVRQRPFRWAVWAVGASAVVNLFWFFAWYFEDLREGYYLWLLSFVTLAMLLAWVRRTVWRSGRSPASRLTHEGGQRHAIQ